MIRDRIKTMFVFCNKSPFFFANNHVKMNKYPLGTTMRPHLAVKLTDGHIFWAGLKHFYSHF